MQRMDNVVRVWMCMVDLLMVGFYPLEIDNAKARVNGGLTYSRQFQLFVLPFQVHWRNPTPASR